MAEKKKAVKRQAKSYKSKKSTSKAKDLIAEGFSTKASVRGVRMSPRKARIVVNMIKGKQVEPALQLLRASSKKAGAFTAKLLQSAISNAVNASADADKLWIKGAWVDMGKTLKRYMPRAQGRATPIRKRSAHITLVLGEK